MTERHILQIGAALLVWYIVSESLSWVYCKFTGVKPEEYDSDEVYTARAGIFMLPVLIPLMICLWLMREMWRFVRRLFGGRDVD